MKTLVVNRCQASGLLPPTLADPGGPAEVMPRLWPQLPLVARNQLAQQLAQLLQRMRSAGGPPTEAYDAERGINR